MSIQFELLRLRPGWARTDVYPFLFAYLALIYWQQSLEDIDENQMSFVYFRLGLIGIIFLQSLAFLSSHWSPHVRARMQFYSGGSVITSQLLQKYPFVKAYHKKPNCKYCEIRKLLKDDQQYYFRFMENKYLFDESRKTFYRLKPNMSFDLFSLDQNLSSLQNKLFDVNSLLIPMKRFNDILKEQLMEPFSFFQMFSISLWLLDGNVIYTLFTLGLLFMTGCTVGFQRMRTLLTLRQMKLNPQYITIYRNKHWVKVSSEDLKPGDICIIQTADQAKPVIQQKPPQEAQQNNQNNFQQVILTEDEQFLKDQMPFSKHLPSRLFKTEGMNVDSFRSLPCDILLLNGGVVVNEAMLTGESVPQVKDSIEQIKHIERLDIKSKHKSNVLFCGTEVVQVQGNLNFPKYVEAPQGPHCLGLVLRTGFETAKGKLIRTVFYNNENAQVHQIDGLVIVFVLLIFALLSSARVLYFGLGDDTRDKNKLFLRCILIVTTVVPPELPMILSIAVNQSLLFLQMRKIFCTEPYRIPWAGKVTVLAFDKTGTLTNDTLKFLGIVDDLTTNLKQKTDCDFDTQTVLAGCHSLVFADNKLQGDPIEILFFEGNNQWNYQAQLKFAINNSKKREVMIRAVFPFKSDLKRMSTLVIQEDNINKKTIKLLTKGAPEAIQGLLSVVPHNFVEQYEYFANLGYRVLCLADRIIDENEFDMDKSLFYSEKAQIIANMDRLQLEQKLIYRGLLICESPLKKDTAQWIQKFTQSYFKPIIITGDNMLTAIAVARALNLNQVGTSVKQIAVLEFQEGKYKIIADKQEKGTSNQNNLLKNMAIWSKEFMLCLPAYTLLQMEGHPQLNQMLIYFKVFARSSPKQKEQIILGLKQAGYGVLMCGDGTNDVGALKKAHVGIALVTKQDSAQDTKDDNDEEEEALESMSFQQQLKRAQIQREETQKRIRDAQGNKEQIKNIAKQQLSQATSEMFDMGNSYKFGDACIAAPFTSKMSTSIRCVHTILKQGICTLVTTIQTYKIMALLSLINAYSMSSLHMQSLKLSENQMTIMGILGAAYYFCYSSAKPQRQLSIVKPSFSIFEFSFLFSLLLQITLHILTMDYAIHSIGIYYSNDQELAIDHDSEFKPTFLNTVVFILQLLQQSCIFLFNHPGEPHMQRLDLKSKFFKSLIIPLGISVICAFNLSDELNYFFELKFPDFNTLKASQSFGSLCLFIIVANYLIERVMKFAKYGQFYGYI